MADLFNKLNTLVKASVHGVLGESTPRRKRRAKLPSLGADIDREIGALRQRIEQALTDEDQMDAEIQDLQRQIADLDAQADHFLAQGDEANARYAVRQIQLLQQRATMLDAELSQHRLSTSELISRVNELEALVAQARQQQAGPPTNDTQQGESLAAKLRKARQSVEQEPVSKPAAEPVRPDDKAVEDDLARRRARLSQ